MQKRTIIIEKDRGIFMGSYNGVAIFSKNDPLESTRAFGFQNQNEAIDFVKNYIPVIEETVTYLDIPTEDELSYVDVVDIIKAGHSHLAKELFMNMPTEPTLH